MTGLQGRQNPRLLRIHWQKGGIQTDTRGGRPRGFSCSVSLCTILIPFVLTMPQTGRQSLAQPFSAFLLMGKREKGGR